MANDVDRCTEIISRRGLLSLFGFIVGATPICLYSQNNNHQGCRLSANAAGGFGGQYEILPSSGNQFIDNTFPLERQILVQTFGVNPSFQFFNDVDAPNAFATTAPIAGPSPDGSVCFGVRLLHAEANTQWWGAAIAGIAAHEWGHIKQLQRIRIDGANWGWVAKRELQADYLAGWYLRVKQMAGTPVVLDGLGQSLFNKGGYDFNNPDWHGTPQQRVGAMTRGFTDPFTPDANVAYNRSSILFEI